MRTPDQRPGVSRRANAASLAAHHGGRSEIGGRHVAVPVALPDVIAAYTAIGEFTLTNYWLQADHIEQRHFRPGHGLEGFVHRLASLTIEDLLTKPELWPELAGVGLVESNEDVLAVRGRAFEAGHGLGRDDDSTILAPVAAGSVPIWQGLPDVVASFILTDRLPRILEAYTWAPVGVTPSARPVTLPGRVAWDPRLDRRKGSSFPTLAGALAEIVLRCKDDALPGIDAPAGRRLGGCVKVARNGVSYGAAVEYNPGRRSHPMWGGTGHACGVVGTTKEEPGELIDPPVGMLATSGCRLLLGLLERLVRDAGGHIAFMDTDAAAIVATPDGGDLIPVPGGPHRDTDDRECVRALSFDEVVEILDRFRPLAVATGLSIPAWRVRRDGDAFTMERTTPSRADLHSLFKITSECLEGDRWVRTEALAVSTKRYVLFRRDAAGKPVSAKPSAHVLGTLANFRADGVVSWDTASEAWELGLSWLGVGPSPVPAPRHLDLTQPVLQPFAPNDPRDFRALGEARFTVERPGGFRPFEELLVPVPVGRGHGRIVAPAEPDPARWSHLELTDAKGRSWLAGTIAQVTAGILGLGRGRGARRLVATDLESWLGSYFERPELGTLGPDDAPCGPQTKGILRIRPIRIVRVHVAGAEPHRRRQEEAVLGWDVRVAQDVPGQSRICIGCGGALEGTARTWCASCRVHRSGTSRVRSEQPVATRTCGCGCGEALSLEQRADARYLDPAHKERARRTRARKATQR